MVIEINKTRLTELSDDNRTLSILANGNRTSTGENVISRPLKFPSDQHKQTGIDINQLFEHSEKVCVSIVDIVGSTRIVSTIGKSSDIRKFYEIFLNKISNILKYYQARIIKTVGDGIISYFPNTADASDTTAFENVLECCFAQIESSPSINSLLAKQRLPAIRYRVSVDFGKVERARFEGFNTDDLFGSTVNVCSKINLFAAPNGIIAGNDFYRVIKSFKQIEDSYAFHEIGSYDCGAGKFSYPLYSLSRLKSRRATRSNLVSSLDHIKKYVVDGIKSSRIPKILLVDDELDDLFVLEEYLIREGFEVKSFSSPKEALRYYANEDPSACDLVISDIRMPEINGFQLYHKLKAINYNVKIVFATCLEIVEEILTLIPELKEDQLIRKPIEKEKFIKIVKKNIG